MEVALPRMARLGLGPVASVVGKRCCQHLPTVSCLATAAIPNYRHTTFQSQLLQRSFSSSAALERRKIPPNVKIDPKSRFFPVSRDEFLEQKREDEAKKRGLDKLFVEEEEDIEEQEEDEKEEGEEDYDEEDDVDDDYDEEDEFYLPQEKVVYAVPLPERLHVPVYTLFAPEYDAQVGTIWLNEKVFGREPVRVDLLKRAVNYTRAKKRGKRKALTKTRATIRGSGRKLRPQKGTGRARIGAARAPHHKGGVKAHGVKGNTDYGRTKLNKKFRRLALAHVLSQKLLEGNLMILNQLYDIPSMKTNDLDKYLKTWNLGGKNGKKCMIIDSYCPKEGEQERTATGGLIESHKGMPVNFVIASNNIPNLFTGSDLTLNVFRILGHETIVLTLAAVQALEARLGDT